MSTSSLDSARAVKETTIRTDTKRFGNECKLALGSYFNTKLSKLDNGTRFFAFLSTLFGLASFGADNGDSREMVAFISAA